MKQCWKKVSLGNCCSGFIRRSLRCSRKDLSHSSNTKLSQVQSDSNTAAVSLGCRSKNPDIKTITTQIDASAIKAWIFCKNVCGRPEVDIVRWMSSAGEYCSL